MSLLYGQAIRDQLELDIMQAWPDVTRVVFGKPVNNQAPDAPYARVDSPEVEYAPHTVSQTEQRYVFVIGIVAPYPTDGRVKVIDLQEERANQLITRLMANRTYAEFAYMPKVNRVLFGQDETEEPTYEVGIEFECRVSVAYIVNDTVLDNSTMNPDTTPLGGSNQVSPDGG